MDRAYGNARTRVISLKVPFIAMVYKGKIIEKLNEQIPKYLKE